MKKWPRLYSVPSLLLATALLLLLTLSIFFFPSSSPKLYYRKQFGMGTLISLTVVSNSRQKAMAAMDRAFQTLTDLEQQTSRKIPTSFTSQLNRSAGQNRTLISPSYLALLKSSLYYSQLTQGAFDITIGSLTSLWHFEDDQGTLPDEKSIRLRLPLVNSSLLELNEEKKTARLSQPGMMIDLGGIAKGWAVDQVVEVLKEEGMTGGIVNAGGNIGLFGLKPGGEKWRIGIQHPRQPSEILTSLLLTDCSITTSGDYERCFFVDQVRYHHILDPKTGYPGRLCQSVTIVSASALAGDALSTGVFILGPEKGLALLESLPEVEGLLIDQDGRIYTTSGLTSSSLLSGQT